MTDKPTAAAFPGNSVVGIHARFEDIPADCREELDGADAEGGFFSTWHWFRYLARSTLAQEQDLRLYCVQSGAGRPLLMAMRRGMPGNASSWGLQVHCLSTLANFYTPLFEPLAGPHRAMRRAAPGQAWSGGIAAALADAWMAERPRWDVIDLHPLDDGDGFMERIAADLRARKMAVQRYFCFGNWYLPVAGRSYDAVYAGLPSRLRNIVERKTRQLAQRLRSDIVTGGARLESAIAAYEAIYRSSWKQAEAFPDFVSGLMRLCAEQGSLRLGIAYVDEQPAAAHFWIVHNGVASIYKLAYDQRFARLSVGSILMDRLMRHVIDIDLVHEIDFLSGDDAYKKDWMQQRRERWGLMAFNLRTLPGLLLAGRHIGGRLAKATVGRAFRRSRWFKCRMK